MRKRPLPRLAYEETIQQLLLPVVKDSGIDTSIEYSEEDCSVEMTVRYAAPALDILAALGQNKREGQFLCGFSMETRDLIENSRKKLMKKNLDMVAANNVKVEGAGFGVETNVLTLITAEGEKELPLMSKDAAADVLLDAILERM